MANNKTIALDQRPLSSGIFQYQSRAALNKFCPLVPKILCGEDLRLVSTVENSIKKHGLLTPLTVLRADDRLIVIDGRKRLIALRRLQFRGALPKDLAAIPFMISSSARPAPSARPALSAQREHAPSPQKYRAVFCAA